MTQHPITPPPDKIHNWLQLQKMGWSIEQIIALAAQWCADTELKACCEVLNEYKPSGYLGELLRKSRRPKPRSLKEQAVQALYRFMASEGHEDRTEEEIADDFTTIRRALEHLPDPS